MALRADLRKSIEEEIDKERKKSNEKNRPKLCIENLQALKSQIPELKELHFSFSERPEFYDWRTRLENWLDLGAPHTRDQLRRIRNRQYIEHGTEEFYALYEREEQYEEDQQKKYRDEMEKTAYDIDQAIQNLERGIVVEREKPSGTPQIVHNQYIVSQAGVVGPNAHAHDMMFNQLQTGWNLTQLAAELSTLRTALKGRASEPEHDMAVGVIAEAEIAAKQGNGQKALAGLKKAGKWTWEVATDIGTTLVAEVIKKQMGL